MTTATLKGKTYRNWDEALAAANKLFDKGLISRDEIDKIARQAYAAKHGKGHQFANKHSRD